MKKRYLGVGMLAAVLVALLAMGPGMEVAGNSTPSAAAQATVAYSVTIENLTANQPLTPPVAAIHSNQADVVEVGQPASEELRQVAENGNNDPLVSLLGGLTGVYDVTTGEAPILPGESATLSLEAPAGGLLTVVSMLICTNDGFTALDSYALPESGTVSVDTNAYDAGTELNSEASPDLVDPCGAVGSLALPEDGNARTPTTDVIAPHPGIQGIADLTVANHGWTDPVARMTISVEASTAGLPAAGSGGFLDQNDGSSTPWPLFLGIGGVLLLIAGGGTYILGRRLLLR